jgi:hypothetical protein
MKKIAISLLALAAVSTVALAGPNRGTDPRDSDTYIGKYTAPLENEATSSDAFAVSNDDQVLSSFERMKRQAEQNEIDGD